MTTTTATANQETHKSVEDIILQDSSEQPEQPELLVLLVPGPPQLTTFSFFGVTKKTKNKSKPTNPTTKIWAIAAVWPVQISLWKVKKNPSREQLKSQINDNQQHLAEAAAAHERNLRPETRSEI